MRSLPRNSDSASLIFKLATAKSMWSIPAMPNGYGQFCPIANAAEVFATRWTPLILRELMADAHGFNEIHRGLPLISRAVLAVRLRELEIQGVVEKRRRGSVREYRLTPAGEALRPIVCALGDWGLTYAGDHLERSKLDPSLLLLGLRRRANLRELPSRQVVVRFEFSGVPATRTKFRIMWLVLNPAGLDVCVKDPGFDVDLVVRGDIGDFVSVYLGRRRWCDVAGEAVVIEGDARIARRLPGLLGLDQVIGRDFPMVRPAA
jgi:DNA-binding HxlR family transcriptional regulator